jgi:hypothetical protein
VTQGMAGAKKQKLGKSSKVDTKSVDATKKTAGKSRNVGSSKSSDIGCASGGSAAHAVFKILTFGSLVTCT